MNSNEIKLINLIGFQHWMIQPIGKWWKSIKHSIAWRLLEVAKSDNHSDRLKAVRQLAQIDHLKGKIAINCISM